MQLISLLLRDSKLTVALAAISGVIGGSCVALLLGLIQTAADPAHSGDLSLLASKFVGLSLLFFLATLGSHIPLQYLSEGSAFKLRLHLIQRILKGRLRYLEQLGSHRLYAALASDVDSITAGLSVVPAILISTVVISGCLIYIGFLSWQALVALLVFMTFAIVLFVLANGWAVGRLAKARDVGDSLFNHFRAVAEGTKELKLHDPRRVAFFDKMLLPDADAYRRTRIGGLAGLEAANAVANLAYFAVLGFLVFLLPVWQSVGDSVLQSAILVFVFMLAPLTTLGNHFHTFAQAGVALAKIKSLGMALEKFESHEELGTARPASSAESVVITGLMYTYSGSAADEQFFLGPIDLDLRPGEILYITGGNGSGKSTLGKLIVGLYEPDSGSIRLNGEEITEAERGWYRQHFTAVFGDFYLFDRLLGIDGERLDERAKRYLTELHLDDKLKIEDGRLSTTNLSTGQRKRLALLVAYLEDRPIYLFDEWAADQDPQFKEIFYTQLLPELKSKGKIVIVITHDDRYFSTADRVVKLADGRLVS
ncbi:MAG TPA: cyclic peptide export ABC transporter [Thermoanaerobaculia bacterium]|jgi:putative ATP-binding cassette transporter|nr:cyclic peptide export ABC transporter [Thermoanaerobaculia bacterium]